MVDPVEILKGQRNFSVEEQPNAGSTESSLAIVFAALCVEDLRSSRLLAPHLREFGRFSAVALPYSKDGPLHFAGLDPLFLRPDQIQIAPGQGFQRSRQTGASVVGIFDLRDG